MVALWRSICARRFVNGTTLNLIDTLTAVQSKYKEKHKEGPSFYVTTHVHLGDGPKEYLYKYKGTPIVTAFASSIVEADVLFDKEMEKNTPPLKANNVQVTTHLKYLEKST